MNAVHFVPLYDDSQGNYRSSHNIGDSVVLSSGGRSDPQVLYIYTLGEPTDIVVVDSAAFAPVPIPLSRHESKPLIRTAVTSTSEFEGQLRNDSADSAKKLYETAQDVHWIPIWRIEIPIEAMHLISLIAWTSKCFDEGWNRGLTDDENIQILTQSSLKDLASYTMGWNTLDKAPATGVPLLRIATGGITFISGKTGRLPEDVMAKSIEDYNKRYQMEDLYENRVRAESLDRLPFAELGKFFSDKVLRRRIALIMYKILYESDVETVQRALTDENQRALTKEILPRIKRAGINPSTIVYGFLEDQVTKIETMFNLSFLSIWEIAAGGRFKG